jgi:hypothetical protein
LRTEDAPRFTAETANPLGAAVFLAYLRQLWRFQRGRAKMPPDPKPAREPNAATRGSDRVWQRLGWPGVLILASIGFAAAFVFYDVPFHSPSDAWCRERQMGVRRIGGLVVCVEAGTRKLVLPPD